MCAAESRACLSHQPSLPSSPASTMSGVAQPRSAAFPTSTGEFLFAVRCLDAEGKTSVRLATRAAHLAWIRADARQLFGGPLRAAFAQPPLGSLLLLRASSFAAVRELLAWGSLMRDAELMFGAAAAGWRLDLDFRLLPLARYAPGAFIIAGLLLALGQRLTRRRADLIANEETS